MQMLDLNNKKQLYYRFMVSLHPQTEKLDTEKKENDVGGFQRTLEHPKTSAFIVAMQGIILQPSQCFEDEEHFISAIIFCLLSHDDPVDDPNPAYEIFNDEVGRKTATVPPSVS
eukprot:3037888-Ditylum_brightwellii.AAC.1